MIPDGRALSYEAAPAYATPLRFFVTAPLFGVAAGVLLMLAPELLASRWTRGALAITHLIAVGFMLMVMVGALFQILPVVAGAVIPGGSLLVAGVHILLTLGAASLAWGLWAMSPVALSLAAWLLGAGFALFLAAAAAGLWRAPVSQATPRDLRIALIGFGIAISLGLTLAMVLTQGLALPLLTLLKLHIGWAWVGGSLVLLAATSWIVVPMFQITPPYPDALTRYWAIAIVGVLLVWSGSVYAGSTIAEVLLVTVLAALTLVYAAATLQVQRRSRRSSPDATARTFQFGMLCLIAGTACTLAAYYSDAALWPILAGILVLYGGFVSVIEGMLYKIVPFLAWLHLTQDGIKAPNMRKLQPDTPVRAQLVAHVVALLALVAAAASGNAWVTQLTGLLVAIQFGWLLVNVVRVVRAYRAARSA